MELLSNDHKDCPNQHKNSHKLSNDTEHPAISLMESQWKLTQHDWNFQWRKNHFRTNISVRRKKEIQQSRSE